MEDEPSGLSAEAVAVLIRDQLVTLPLRGGERIFETQIARELEVNRPLVREACRLLENEGLLVYTPNKGFSLKRLTRQQVLDLVEFRILLEEAAMAKVAAMPDRGAVVSDMRRAYQGIIDAAASENPAVQISADLAFHRVSIEHAGNPWLLQSFDRLTTQIRYAIRLMSRSLHDFKVYASAHEILIECVELGEPDRAKAEINKHIRMFIPNLLKRIQEAAPESHAEASSELL